MTNADATATQLPFHPWNKWAEYRDTIIAAKQATGYTQKIVPRPAQPGDTKVICVETPPFLCEYAIVKSGSVEGFTHALLWLLGIREDKRIVTMAKMLTNLMGEKVKEITNERTDTARQHINPEPENVVEPRPRETDGYSAGVLW